MHFTRPSGVITLTTDFGLRDPFVGVMKGVILARNPAARIVDLTHEVLPHWPAEAGFWLQRSFEYFAPGTIHVAVVDPGVGTARELLAVELQGHLLLAPDNGLLAPVLEGRPQARMRRIDLQRLASYLLPRVSSTFHGRDVFAPLAAEIAAGRLRAGELGPLITSCVPAWQEPARVEHDAIYGNVITFDHFGNILTNIDAELLRGFVEPQVYAAHQMLPLRRTYGDVKPGDLVALVNSFGVVEIARAEGHAADTLGLSRGAPVVVRDALRHR